MHFRFMLRSDSELVVSICLKLPAQTILELLLRSNWCILSILSHLLSSHSEDLHFAMGTGTTGHILTNGIQSGRLPRVKSLTVEL